MFENSKIPPYCPIQDIDFLWIAEYNNGVFYPQVNFEENIANDFKKIQKDILRSFGVVGCGMKIGYDASYGHFDFGDRTIDFKLKVGEKLINLTGEQREYKDIICFCDAYVDIDMNDTTITTGQSNIEAYNVGYKINIDNLKFQCICKIPVSHVYDKPVSIEIQLLSDESIDCELHILKDSKPLDVIPLQLERNLKKITNWIVR